MTKSSFFAEKCNPTNNWVINRSDLKDVRLWEELKFHLESENNVNIEFYALPALRGIDRWQVGVPSKLKSSIEAALKHHLKMDKCFQFKGWYRDKLFMEYLLNLS